MQIETFIIDLIKLTIGVSIGSFLGAKIMQYTLKKQILEIIEELKNKYSKEYDTKKIKNRAIKILSDIETLIKHANKFFGVKQNEWKTKMGKMGKRKP